MKTDLKTIDFYKSQKQINFINPRVHNNINNDNNNNNKTLDLYLSSGQSKNFYTNYF